MWDLNWMPIAHSGGNNKHIFKESKICFHLYFPVTFRANDSNIK